MQWFKIIFFLEIILISFCASNIILNQDPINNFLVNHYLNKYSEQQQVYEEPLSSLEKIIVTKEASNEHQIAYDNLDIILPTGEMGTEQIFGHPMHQDPSDPEYYKLVEESLAYYSKSSKTKLHYKPTKITEVFTQIVAGLLTTIYFEASATNCDVDSHGHPTSSECAVQNENNVLSCISVILETPWIKKKDIGVKCFPDDSVEVQGDEYDQDKEEFIDPSLDGFTRQDPEDPEYFKLAEESLAKYIVSSGIRKDYKPIEIVEVTTQLVSGVITKIYFKASANNCELDTTEQLKSPICEGQTAKDVLLCYSKIWDQSWTNMREIDVACKPSVSKIEGIQTEKHTAMGRAGEIQNSPLGGRVIQDVNDPKYFKLAEKSLAKYVVSSGIKKHYKPTEIVKVTTQVVSGIVTRIDFKASATNCEVEITGQPSSFNCDVQIPKDTLLCHSEIWDQPLFNKRDIDVSCSPSISNDKTTQRQMYIGRAIDNQMPLLGGEIAQDVNDPKYFKLAQKSLAQYFALSGFRNLYKPTEIVKVTTQVVSGVLTRIDFKASASNCENCGVIYCQSKILEQPWLNSIDDIEISCA